MSAKGHKRTLRVASFDHFVGRDYQSWRDSKTKCLGRFQVESCLKFGRRLHRKFTGFRSAQDTVNICGGLPEHFDLIGSVGHQATQGHKKAKWIDGRQLVLRRKRENKIAMVDGRNVWWQNQAAICSTCN